MPSLSTPDRLRATRGHSPRYDHLHRAGEGSSGPAGSRSHTRRLRSVAGAAWSSQEVGIASIAASGLRHGVHRASERHRARREAFVEALLAAFPVFTLDLLAARVHARLWVALARAGIEVGARDRIVAATALSACRRVGTAKKRHFERIAGLEIVDVSLA